MKVLQRLRELQFYLSRSKLDLFSDRTDCLGYVIDDNGIHAELDNCGESGNGEFPEIVVIIAKQPKQSSQIFYKLKN